MYLGCHLHVNCTLPVSILELRRNFVFKSFGFWIDPPENILKCRKNYYKKASWEKLRDKDGFIYRLFSKYYSKYNHVIKEQMEQYHW